MQNKDLPSHNDRMWTFDNDDDDYDDDDDDDDVDPVIDWMFWPSAPDSNELA